jgi:hypothetical protein
LRVERERMTATTVSQEQLTTAKVELGKFFTLAFDGVPNMLMFSPLIDSVWHDLLKSEEEYSEFCNALGVPRPGHQPMNGAGKITWISEYEARFGKLDSVWFMRVDGSVFSDVEEAYRKTGDVVCSWDCGVVYGTE